ncbi:MAG: transposase [Bacteroidetes bacterium]|nr:transposase [Bacteroidota bacterium]
MDEIHKDEAMKTNYELIRSIKGIGMVNALMTIAYTENFVGFTNPRSYAVYVGVVPLIIVQVQVSKDEKR